MCSFTFILPSCSSLQESIRNRIVKKKDKTDYQKKKDEEACT